MLIAKVYLRYSWLCLPFEKTKKRQLIEHVHQEKLLTMMLLLRFT
jgi:hypothetical protein